MKCQVPGCNNEATVHLTEIIDNVKHEMHLCEKCAQEKGLPGKAHFSISELLGGLANNASQSRKTVRGKETRCGGCGMTLSQFQSSGRFGCPECYGTFRDDIMPLVEKIHDSGQHVGKVPARVSKEVSLRKDIRHLQLELRRTVKKEDYENAARLRDQIHGLEVQLKELEAAAKPAKPRKKAKAKGAPSDEGDESADA